MAKKRSGTCIYCNEPAKNIREGEHILPEAMGGALTIVDKAERLVCRDCNNGPLSVADKELCERSYLSLIASQELNEKLWQVWDVDTSTGELVEARASWNNGELDNVICFPQMYFDHRGVGMRGDALEMERFGRENFENVLVKAVYGAFQRWQAGEKRNSLILEPVESGIVEQGYSFRPRVCARHTIREIAENIHKQTFVLRYKCPEDKRLALRKLSELEPRRTMKRWTGNAGSHHPAIANYFDLGITLRGLVKIGVNLLAAFCTRTPVTVERFRWAMRLVRGLIHPLPPLLRKNGFVNARKYFQDFNAPDRAHAFRLMYADKHWHLHASFFGGRIGAYALFPGPNWEDWNRLDVVAPLGSKDWRVEKLGILVPLKFEMGWKSLQDFAPSARILNPFAELTVEEVERKPPRRKRA